MNKTFIVFLAWLITASPLIAQQIKMVGTAPLQQVYGTVEESETLLSMNDLNVEFGYVLYQTEISLGEEDALLEVENVRDYAVIYLNDGLQGTLTDSRKTVNLKASPGTYTLSLYVENIGRITYGPEILDNSKGLFGEISLGGEPVGNWKITELRVKDAPVGDLVFSERKSTMPCFHKGYFDINTPNDVYLDVSGWGMGEVWINNTYMGSYWEEEKQQSILIPSSVLAGGRNEVVVFELKNNSREAMGLCDVPVFK